MLNLIKDFNPVKQILGLSRRWKDSGEARSQTGIRGLLPYTGLLQHAEIRPVEPIAPPQDASLLVQEVYGLSPDSALVETEEYLAFHAKAHSIPRLLFEIGRLREIAFRGAGEGTGRAIDLDEFDAHYIHLCLWSKESDQLVGAYRLGPADEILRRYGKSGLYTSTLFKYRAGLLESLGPALEMGRSFIRLEYQKGIAPLFYLWKGIGRYVVRNPQYKILFGPVSISSRYSPLSQQLIVRFLKERGYMHGLAGLVTPMTPFQAKENECFEAETVASIRDIEHLSEIVSTIESDRKSLPILLKQYLKLDGKFLGFNIDPNFSDVLDGLILVDLTRTDFRMLERYLGEDGAAAFMAYHSGYKPVAACV